MHQRLNLMFGKSARLALATTPVRILFAGSLVVLSSIAEDNEAPTSLTRKRTGTDTPTVKFEGESDPLSLEVIFKPILYGWLKDLESKLKNWCTKACELDKGEPVGAGVKQSSSLIDVSIMIYCNYY